MTPVLINRRPYFYSARSSRGTAYCDGRVCLCLCAWRANGSPELHAQSFPILYAYYLQPWLGPPLALACVADACDGKRMFHTAVERGK